MRISDELSLDFDILSPKVTANTRVAIIENMRKAIQISDTSITVDAGRFYVTVRGEGFKVGELMEGRMELAGIIQSIEFFRPLDQSGN